MISFSGSGGCANCSACVTGACEGCPMGFPSEGLHVIASPISIGSNERSVTWIFELEEGNTVDVGVNVKQYSGLTRITSRLEMSNDRTNFKLGSSSLNQLGIGYGTFEETGVGFRFFRVRVDSTGTGYAVFKIDIHVSHR